MATNPSIQGSKRGTYLAILTVIGFIIGGFLILLFAINIINIEIFSLLGKAFFVTMAAATFSIYLIFAILKRGSKSKAKHS